jgi:hypothetical protein
MFLLPSTSYNLRTSIRIVIEPSVKLCHWRPRQIDGFKVLLQSVIIICYVHELLSWEKIASLQKYSNRDNDETNNNHVSSRNSGNDTDHREDGNPSELR